MIESVAPCPTGASWSAVSQSSYAPPPWSIEEPQPFRVAFVITRADAVGGASIHVRDLASHLIGLGMEAKVFLGGTGAVTDALAKANVPFEVIPGLVRKVDPAKDARALYGLARALSVFAPDLVSCHTSKAGVIGRLVAFWLGIPAIYTPHCWSFVDGFPGARAYLLAEKMVRPFGRRTIMVSEAERQDGLRHHVAPPQHLVTVHNGMPDLPEEFRAKPETAAPRIVMVGRFEEQKDHPTLLHALGTLKDLDWTLDLIGDGPKREENEALADALGLSSRIRFLRYRTDVASILAEAQIFALITHWEGFPRSIIEAMRAGLPVVASDVGGNAESVLHGQTGFIVPRRSVEKVASSLRNLIEDPSLRQSLGHAGRRAYEAHFTIQRMVRDTLQVWANSVPPRKAKQIHTYSISPQAPALATTANV